MNISKDKDGYTTIHCHNCDEDCAIDPASGIGDVTYDEYGIHCLYCDTVLGYEEDLEEYRKERNG